MQDTFNSARSYIYRFARRIEFARWKYHFENGSKEDVMDALSDYQNEDGGFGNSLDPDIFCPSSSPIETLRAIEIISEISYENKDHPVIQNTLKYLENCPYFNGRVYSMTIPEFNKYPCAHWWFYRKDDPRNEDYCPTAGIAGFILKFSDRNSSVYRFGRKLANASFESVLKTEKITDPYLLFSYISLANLLVKSNILDVIDVSAYVSKLRVLVTRIITPDPEKWALENTCRPSMFVKSRNSTFYNDIKNLAETEKDYIIRTQNPDGTFPSSKIWLSNPSEFAVSSYIDKSDQIILNMLYLKGFGAI